MSLTSTGARCALEECTLNPDCDCSGIVVVVLSTQTEQRQLRYQPLCMWHMMYQQSTCSVVPEELVAYLAALHIGCCVAYWQ